MAVLFVLLMIILALSVDYFIQKKIGKRLLVEEVIRPIKALIPSSLFLSPNHVWFKLQDSGNVSVGIDSLIYGLLGKVDDVKCAKGSVKIGEVLFTLKSGKRTLDIKAPFDCEVVKAYDVDNLSDAAYGSVLCSVVPLNLSNSVKTSFIGSEARRWLEEELSKLRDVICEVKGCGVMADGGAPAVGFSKEFNDNQWDIFVSKFFG